MQQAAVQAGMIEITYREAVREAIRDVIKRDERVFLMGEDVGRYGGCYAVSKGLLAEPWGARSRSALRHHLSAPGCDRRVRQDGRAAMGR